MNFGRKYERNYKLREEA